MARIKIKDLNPKMKISREEMKKVLGGQTIKGGGRVTVSLRTLRSSGAREWTGKNIIWREDPGSGGYF